MVQFTGNRRDQSYVTRFCNEEDVLFLILNGLIKSGKEPIKLIFSLQEL